MKIFRPETLGGGVRIAGTGAYLPAREVSNAELVAMGAPLAAEEIVRLTGIESRRFAAPEEATSDLAAEACRRALLAADLPPAKLERLILGTVSPDHLSPSAACFVHRKLELSPIPAHDVTASCSGFLYALELAARAVATGDAAVLACAADVRSRFVNVHDRATCALFGDGAGAAVLTPGPVGKGLVAIGTSADGGGAQSVYVPAGGSREPASAESVEAARHAIRMEEGPQVYLAAVEGMINTAEVLLGPLGMTFADVDLVVPHQPNRRILDRIARLARLREDQLFINVERRGNISGASCAIAFDEALRSGRLHEGMKVLLLAGGAGYTVGAALLVIDETLVASAGRS